MAVFNDVYKSANNGGNWTVAKENLFDVNFRSMISKDNKLFASGGYSVFSSIDKGTTWTQSANGLPTVNFNCVLGSNATTLFGFIGNQVYSSTNNGGQWNLINSTDFTGWQVSDVITKGVKMYAYTNKGIFSGIYGFFYSDNNGLSWTQTTLPTNVSSSVTGMISRDTSIFLANGFGVHESSDNGLTWTLRYNASKPVVITQNDKAIFLGINEGYLFSTNNGRTWQDASANLIGNSASSLTISGNYIIANTANGVYRRLISELVRVGTKEENALDFTCTVSPNPVANQLTINCSEALIGKKCVIKNVLGETMQSAVLANYATEINVHNFANGIYFLQLIGVNKTIKFVKN
jgi:hypothetical protein